MRTPTTTIASLATAAVLSLTVSSFAPAQAGGRDTDGTTMPQDRRPQRRPSAVNIGPSEISAIGRCRHAYGSGEKTAHTFSGDFCA